MIAAPETLALRVGPRQFQLERDTAKTGVIYDNRLQRAERFSVEEEVLGTVPSVRFEIPGFRMTLLDLAETPAGQSFGPRAADDQLSGAADVSATFPVYSLGDKRVVLTPQLSVGFDPAVTDATTLAADIGLPLVSSGRGFAILGVPEADSIFARLAEIEARPGVRFVEPDLVTIGARVRPPAGGVQPFSVMMSAEVQIAFRKVRAPEAWDRTAHPANLRIAVLDDGFDLAHPALAPAVVASFDAATGAPDATANPWDYHGTACAGIIVGRSEVPPFRGIAAGASLLAVRIAQSPAPWQPWATSNSIIRRGIDWAVDQGADVLSNSWGGPPSAVVADGIRQGLQQGRGGKGSVFVAAAGNSGGPVEFPATLSGVIAVSGVTLDDTPKTFTSADGETWWASNFGPEIDIAAPAVRIRTSDTDGAPGRTPTGWRDDFNGTSAACPMVAGAAALVLAAQPNLSADDVAARLTDTAERVTTIDWIGGPRNDHLGNGRLDILAAVTNASSEHTLSGRITAVRFSTSLTLFRIAGPQGAAVFLPHPDDRAALEASAASVDIISIKSESREETAIGQVLLGARRAQPSTAPSRDLADEPAPGEVLLPRPEDDVFAQSSSVEPLTPLCGNLQLGGGTAPRQPARRKTNLPRQLPEAQ